MSDNMVKMKAVKDKILNGYDKSIRPTKEGSNATEIHSALIPRQIMQVDEDRGLFILDSFFFMYWNDPRLLWDTITEYNGDIQLPVDSLWKPDLSVYNSHSISTDPTQPVPLLVASNGNVYWVPPIFTQTTCPKLVEVAYPNEVVNCNVTFGSWTSDGWQIDFGHGKRMYMDEFTNMNPRWELLVSEAKVIRNVKYYECCEEPYVSLDAIFPLKRRMPPEIEATRNPCILIMLLTLSIFWLPTNSSKKVHLGGILFLSLTILLIYVAWSTKLPVGVLFAVSFLQSTMYILAVTLLLEILVIFNMCNVTGPVRPPPIVMQLLTGPVGKYACVQTSVNDFRVPLKPDSPSSIESPTPTDDWMLFAAGLDRLFFLLMSIAMIAVHHL